MCYFITVGIDEKYVDVLQEHMPPEFHLLPNDDPTIQRLFRPKAPFWACTSEWCDCSLGFALTQPDSEEETEEQFIAHFREAQKRKGWPASKIERALANSLVVRHDRPPRENPSEELAVAFLSWMRQVASRIGEVAILIHMYGDGRRHLEAVEAQGRLILKLRELVGGTNIFPAERIVTIVAKAR